MGNCSSNTCADIISSGCVSWQGTSYEELKICMNDSLTKVTGILLDKISDVLKGKGILLPDLNLEDCEYIKDLLGTNEKNLLNMLDVYKNAVCDLKETLDGVSLTLEGFINIQEYHLGFLTPDTPCGTPFTFRELMQGILDKVTDLNEKYNNLAVSLGEAMQDAVGEVLLNGAVASSGNNGIEYTGEGKSAKITLTALVPPYCPIIFTGSRNSFDITGKGIANSPYKRWFICNGNNGTPNSSTLPQNSAGNLTYIIRFD